jgi:acetylglutamate kinase
VNVVLKCGGSILVTGANGGSDGMVLDAVARYGGRVALVHGGGPHISDALAAARVDSTFVGGLRVTSPAAMPVVERVLLEVNHAVVASLRVRGRKAIGADGREGKLFACERTRGPAGENLDRVGRVVSVNVSQIDWWWRCGLVPVIAPLGLLDDGFRCNINADDVAGALAGALGVPAVFVTDVPGVILDARLHASLGLDEVERAVRDGHISGGMIPKVFACVRAVRCGAPYASIVPAGKDVLRGGGTRIFATRRERAL